MRLHQNTDPAERIVAPELEQTQRVQAALFAGYIRLLREHDWSFELTDNHAVWSANRDSLEALRVSRQLIDPDGAVWNQFAPQEWRITP